MHVTFGNLDLIFVQGEGELLDAIEDIGRQVVDSLGERWHYGPSCRLCVYVVGEH